MGKRVFSDPSIVAFFQASTRPFRVTPFRNDDSGQVEFLVEGEDIDGALTALYANQKIGALDYVRSLKGLRSSIFALKGQRR